MGASDRQQLLRVLNINSFPALPLDLLLLRPELPLWRCQPATEQLLPRLSTSEGARRLQHREGMDRPGVIKGNIGA